MAVIIDAERAALHGQWMRDNRDACAVNKPDLRAAINAIDDWVEANAAAFNAAIPQPARANLSAKQKAMLLSFVALRRFGAF